MFVKHFLMAAALTAGLCTPALAGDLTITDAYARVSSSQSMSGAVFMQIANSGSVDDRLIGASTDVAQRVELHTHTEDANGVMRMTEIEGGIPVAAGSMHALARGGDHVMLMGLTRSLNEGDAFALTLTFEKAGAVELEVSVNNSDTGGHSGHGMKKSGHGG